MRGRAALGIVLAIAAASPAHAGKKKKAKKKDRTTVLAEAETRGGVLTGEGTVRQTAAFAAVEATVTPRIERGRWRFDLPVEVTDRETFGATFPERSGEVDPEVRWKRGARLHAAGHAGVAGTWRPDWPDPYQPAPGGEMLPTSRRSHLDVFAGAELGGIPVRHHHARAELEFRRVDYDADESYDPIDAPTHLVPGDTDSIDLDTSWMYHADAWKLGGAVEVSYQHWRQQYARDAGDGATHAGSGGPPPNPLQSTIGVEPAVVGEITRGALEVDVSYGVPMQKDLFQGYYSFVEQHPELDVTVDLARVDVKVSTDLRWRSYGANSYAPAPPDHPALDFGTRRSDRTFTSALDVTVPLRGGLAAIAGIAYKMRRTNFPDYTPGVFPMSQQYSIDWDYDDVTAFAGVSWTRGEAD